MIPTAMLNILIVADSPEDRLVLRRLLTRSTLGPHTITEAERGDHAIDTYRLTQPDCVLLDHLLPDMDGMAVLTALRVLSDVPVVLLTGVSDEALAVAALQHGAQDYLLKDYLTPDRLLLTIQRAIATVQYARERNRTQVLLATMLDIIPVGVAMLDENLHTLHLNLALTTLLGRPAAELLGQPITALWPAMAERLAPHCAQVLATGQPTGPYDVVAPSPGAEAPTRIWQISIHPLMLPETGALGLRLVIQEMTAMHQASAAAAEARARLDATITNLPNGICYLDRELRYQMVNPALAALNGKTPEEHIGLTPADVSPGLARKIEPLIRQVLATGEPVRDLEIQGPPSSLDGVRHNWLFNYFPVPGPDGAVSGVGITVVDLTQIKRTEAALRASEERFRLLTEHAYDLVYRYQIRPTPVLEYVSPAIERMSGYPRDAFYADPHLVSHLLYPDDSSIFWDRLATATIREEPSELHWQHKNGTTIWGEIRSWHVTDVNGTTLAVEGIVRDITAHKQAKAALEHERQQLHAIVHTMREGMIAFHPDGTIVQMNAAARQLSGLADASPAVMAPLNMLDWPTFVSPLDAAGLALAPEAWPQHRVLRGEQFTGLELCMRAAGPDLDRWLTFNGTPVYDEYGTFILGVMTAQDITQRKVDELAVQAHAEALSYINTGLNRVLRDKDEFLATMSHELRTPLNSILAFAEILSEQITGTLNARQIKQVQHIETSGQHLLTLINDILDLAKVESGRLEIHSETYNINEICEASLRFVREVAARKGLQVSFVGDATSVLMQVDMRRLKQMLVNLLGNAVKFTPTGGQVRLQVDTDAAQGLITFAVEDTGIGIAAENLGRLFQPFTQIDNSLTRQHEGTGLGLALVRRLAGLMGGSVVLASAGVGKGCRVTLSLPWRPIAPLLNTPVKRESLPDLQTEPAQRTLILLAEDNETTSSAISEYLAEHRYQVVVVRTGQEAITRAIEVQPALILMDIQMPVLDGLAATRQLRALPGFATTPIIALTALAMPDDRERCLAAGANAYLSKPVSLHALVATITAMLSSNGAGAEAQDRGADLALLARERGLIDL